MENLTSLADGYKVIQQYLASIEATDWTIKMYQEAYHSLESFYYSEGQYAYSSEANRSYRDIIEKQLLQGVIFRHQGHYRRRLSLKLDDIFAGHPVQVKYSSGRRYKYKLNANYETLLKEFKANLTVSPNTISTVCSIARDFFYYLQQNGHNITKDISADTIVGFLNFESHSHKSSMNNVLCYLRKIIVFLGNNGYKVTSIDNISYRTARSRQKIYPAFSEEDLNDLLSAPNRVTPMGKRDYAVLLLASFTGLRAIDVANMKFENIDRGNCSIRFVQHKTGHLNALPINKDVLDAIDDYTENARPNCNLPYLFLTMDRPYRKLHDKTSVSNIVKRYMRLCGTKKEAGDGKSFHAFRRTMGKWLLESSSDAQMISQILGHRDQDVLKRYLPLSTGILRECALDFTYAPLGKGMFK